MDPGIRDRSDGGMYNAGRCRYLVRRFFVRPSMHRHSFTGIWVCLLAIWMQILAPAAAMAMQQQTIDPLAVICSHSANTGSDQSGQHGHGHHCCPLCQCHHVGGLLADGRPAFTSFDYPVASPLRWRSVVVPGAAYGGDSLPQPRGPPVLV